MKEKVSKAVKVWATERAIAYSFSRYKDKATPADDAGPYGGDDKSPVRHYIIADARHYTVVPKHPKPRRKK